MIKFPVSRKARPVSHKSIGVGVFLLGLCVFAYFLREYKLANWFLTCETKNFLHGIRLHSLPFFNFKEHYTQNFFHFLFTTLGGIRFHTTFISSGIYNVLGIPLSEYWLLFPYVLLGIANLLLTYFLGVKLGDWRVGLGGAILFAVNPNAITSSRWDNAETSVTFVVLLGMNFLVSQIQAPSLRKSTLLGTCLFFLCFMESIFTLPLFFLWQVFFAHPLLNRKEKCFAFFKDRHNFLIWGPVALALAIHAYYYGKPMDLGLFGYANSGYSGRSGLGAFLPRLQYIFEYYFGYYSKIFLILTLFGGAFVLVKGRKSLPFSFSFLAFGFVGVICLFLYLSSLLVHHSCLYIVDPLNLLFFSSVWVCFHDQVSLLLRKPILKTGFSLLFLISFLYTPSVQALTELQKTLQRPDFYHPLKSAGYFVRKYGGKKTTVFNLFDCDSRVCFNQLTEYYYGKQLRNPAVPSHPRTLFCSGTASIEEILKAYSLDQADFYVVMKGYLQTVSNENKFTEITTERTVKLVSDLKLKGAKKVAEIHYKNVSLGEIYSFMDHPVLTMDVQEYDRYWEKEFAHLKTLLEGPWTGIVSTDGQKFNKTRGY